LPAPAPATGTTDGAAAEQQTNAHASGSSKSPIFIYSASSKDPKEFFIATWEIGFIDENIPEDKWAIKAYPL
jgi:hypothetical protein